MAVLPTAQARGTWVPNNALRLEQVTEQLRLLGVFPAGSHAAANPTAAHNVVKSWRLRGKLCPEDGTVLGVPWWRPATVGRWVRRGGHLDRRSR